MNEKFVFWVTAWIVATIIQSVIIVKALDAGRAYESINRSHHTDRR